MKPAPFDYDRPDTLAAALALLAKKDLDTKILAGGQSLVPMMNFRLVKPERLIDINRLPGLSYIRLEGNEIAIGALARHTDIKDSALVTKHVPLMHTAYEWIAHAAVRNRGTLCGNLCHNDPASEMPAIMLICGSVMVVQSQAKTRRIAASDFFLGMYETAIKPDEMLVEVRVPIATAGQTFGFEEVSMRKGDYAWAVVACTATVAGGKFTNVAVAAAGIGTRAIRVPSAEKAANGNAATQATCDAAGQAAYDAVEPFGDVANSAQYRRDLVRVLVSRTLAQAAALPAAAKAA